jgi:nitroreductase
MIKLRNAVLMVLTSLSANVICSARQSDAPIQELILKRWSPRAMSGQPIQLDQLMQLFEAARWAPSSYNEQPWRFIYGIKGTEQWNVLFDFLVPFNKSWAMNASVLVLLISKKTFTHDGSLNGTHSFDAGAAWQNFALQGSSMGLVVHGMAGFDMDHAREILSIGDDYSIEAMIAVGMPAHKSVLPEYMHDNETPSLRKPVTQIVSDENFIW